MANGLDAAALESARREGLPRATNVAQLPIPAAAQPPIGAPPTPSIGQLAQGPTVTPSPPKTEEERQGLVSRWLDALAKPEVKAALLQFGISMIQPIGPGGTRLGQVGQSIASAGGAVRRFQDRETAETERTRKGGIEERETQVKERGAATQEERTQILKDKIKSAEDLARGRAVAAIQQKQLELDAKLLETIIKAEVQSLTGAGAFGDGEALEQGIDINRVLQKYEDALRQRTVRSTVAAGRPVPTTVENVKRVIKTFKGNPAALNTILGNFPPETVRKARQEMEVEQKQGTRSGTGVTIPLTP